MADDRVPIERRDATRDVPETQPDSEIQADVLHKAGQREVNLIWEGTQRQLALSLLFGALLASLVVGVFGKWIGTPDLQLASLVFLYGVANNVVGFYFGRTNHQRTGGIGGDRAGPR